MYMYMQKLCNKYRLVQSRFIQSFPSLLFTQTKLFMMHALLRDKTRHVVRITVAPLFVQNMHAFNSVRYMQVRVHVSVSTCMYI